MLDIVSKQIENINEALSWIKVNKPDDYKVKFFNLVEQRRKLNVVRRAAGDNPGVAAFGESQVGKSYLMSCFLQKQGTPFMVKSDDKEYNFVFDINPPGGGKEATGVVTRFTSFKRGTNRYNKTYPVLAKCFTVSDIILILSDTYFNDFNDYTTYGESEIEDEYKNIVNKYLSMPVLGRSVLVADDIFEMKRYFEKHINNAQVFRKTSFFEEVALIIDRVPTNDYVTLFQIFWNNNKYLTGLFERLLGILRRLDFKEYIYMPIDAVLHHRIEEDTLMSVQCLKQLLNSGNPYKTEVYIKNGDVVGLAGTFTKSEIGAVCAEVIYKIEEDFLNSAGNYCIDGVSSRVQSKISKDKIEMSILRDNDLLDFPGARSRLTQSVNDLLKDDIILEALLRGKVAYLFNKYNEALSINVLLYCHHDIQTNVTNLWQMLNDWVNTYVGDTPEKRQDMLDKTKVSPLFYIATKFNIDMKYDGVNPSANGKTALEQRWKGRFETVLLDQCIRYNNESVKWVKNWNGINNFFNNSYLLRDYKFSGPAYSQLYGGFDTCGHEDKMLMPSDYYSEMRDTFVNHAIVRKLFSDPEIAWDLAASKQNDGSLYIIEQLSIVASRMWASREKLFADILKEATMSVNDAIKDYYIPADKGKRLEMNIQKAKNVFRELSFTCNADNYYFGHLVQALQITEAKCYQIVHEIMQNPEMLNVANDFKNYEIILKDCELNGRPLEKCTKEKEKWEAIMYTYGFSMKEEASNYLISKKVDSALLFGGEYRKLKNSNIIADYIYNAWCDSIKSIDFMKTFTSEDSFNSSVMADFINNIIETSRHIKLSDMMADSIAEYVDVIDIHKANESFLADVLSDAINDFVLDFGFSTYSEEEILSIKKLGETRNLPIFNYISRQAPAVYDEKQLTELFNSMSTNPKALIPSFEEHYYQWIEYMYISYIAHLNIPNFDPVVNNALKDILENLKTTMTSAS